MIFLKLQQLSHDPFQEFPVVKRELKFPVNAFSKIGKRVVYDVYLKLRLVSSAKI